MTAEAAMLAVSPEQDATVARLMEARDALQQVSKASEAKRVLDVAISATVYARRQHLSDEIIAQAHTLKVEALALLGELLASGPKASGTRGQLSGRDASGGAKVIPPEQHPVPTYSDLGLDKRTASEAQKLAALPKAIVEAIASGTTTLRKVLAGRRGESRRAAGDVIDVTPIEPVQSSPARDTGGSAVTACPECKRLESRVAQLLATIKVQKEQIRKLRARKRKARSGKSTDPSAPPRGPSAGQRYADQRNA
jgi:hypothetical protein